MGQFGSRAFLDIELKVPGNEERYCHPLGANLTATRIYRVLVLPEVTVSVTDLASDLPLGFICDRDEAMDSWRQMPVEVILPRHDKVRRP